VNRGELRARIYDITGLNQDDVMATPAQVNRHIASALRTVTSDYDWPWLIDEATVTLVAGTGDYAVPATWLKTYDLIVTAPDLGPLTYVSPLGIDGMFDGVERGVPTHFTIVESMLRIRPVPNASGTATHRFKLGEPALTADFGAGSTPLMPAEFHDQLCELAAGMTLRSTRDSDRANEYFQAYAAWSKRLRDEGSRKKGARRIRVRAGGWLGN